MANDMKVHPDFLEFESKVNQVAKLIEDMIAAQTAEGEQPAVLKTIESDIDLENFIATTDGLDGTHKTTSRRLHCKGDEESTEDDSDDSELNEFEATEELRKSGTTSKRATNVSKASIPKEPQSEKEKPNVMDKFTFMQQLEKDADKRAAQRRERENIAQEFRTLGNNSYRSENYEHAILMYTKAIEHVKDSPILYNNRAMCYIKLKNYKRALIECDYVLNKLDNRNLHSWIYRAAASKRNLEPQDYESSIRMAKETNSKQHELIDEYVRKIEMDTF